jgi:hypothetical protein
VPTAICGERARSLGRRRRLRIEQRRCAFEPYPICLVLRLLSPCVSPSDGTLIPALVRAEEEEIPGSGGLIRTNRSKSTRSLDRGERMSFDNLPDVPDGLLERDSEFEDFGTPTTTARPPESSHKKVDENVGG